MSDPPSGKRGGKCSMKFRVRYFECDPMGYLHHANYWVYFEQIRTELLRRHGFRYRDLEARGTFFVVHKLACTFRRPVRYDDQITVDCQTERITHTRIDHSYRITRDGKLLTEAATTLVCVGPDGQPIAMPKELWPTP